MNAPDLNRTGLEAFIFIKRVIKYETTIGFEWQNCNKLTCFTDNIYYQLAIHINSDRLTSLALHDYENCAYWSRAKKYTYKILLGIKKRCDPI